jgi:hypothetical protein
VSRPVVYLIHFAWPLGDPDPAATRSRAYHYLGTTYDLRARLRQHGSGQGAAIMRAVRDQSIPWFVARTWVGGRALERALKRRHNNPSFCPACRIAPWELPEVEVDELEQAAEAAAELELELVLEDRHDRGEVAS